MVDLIVLTDRRQASRPLEDVIAAAVDGGARVVVLRETDLPDGQRRELAACLHAMLAAAGGRLLVAGGLAGSTAHGCHLSAADAGPASGYFGRSCHDQDELAAAAAEGAAYATLAPVFPTRSWPEYPRPLGLAGLARLCAAVPLPVYALGGVDTPARVSACRAEGASGVAVMGAIMRAENPGRLVKELSAA